MILKKPFIALLLLTAWITSSYPQGTGTVTNKLLGTLNAIQTTVPFLTIAPDSRAGAMGDLGVATMPDVNSQHWNAAKYPFIKGQAGVSLAYTPWLRKRLTALFFPRRGHLQGYGRGPCR